MKNYAIILASGAGERSGLDMPKQFVKIAGKSVLEHTLKVFQENIHIDQIIVVTNSAYVNFTEELIRKNNFSKVTEVVKGGDTRRKSSYIGINTIREENAKVLIHDAVRPFITSRIIDDCISALDKYKAVDVAITSADTIIKVKEENVIEDIPARKYLRRGQTPQAFDLKIIKKAHELANGDKNVVVTDDCGLIMKYGLADVYVVEGDDSNIKITYPIDVAIADKLFQLKTYNGEAKDLSKLNNKTIVVFGGNSGIGLSICKIAKEFDAKVYPYSRSNGVDITNIESVKSALEKVYAEEGSVDYVINTAGILVYGEINTRVSDDIENEIKTNYFGCINVAQAAYKYLEKSKGGLLFFSSSSYTRGRKNYAVYSSSKAAVVNFTQALSEEWEDSGINVNVIVPERTATPMRLNSFGKEPESSLLSPNYVAEVALNTLLDNVTGQVINVSNDKTIQ